MLQMKIWYVFRSLRIPLNMPDSLDAHHETRKLQGEVGAALAEAEALTVWKRELAKQVGMAPRPKPTE